jgi:spermidine/putrescine transport system permease protein
MRWIKSRLLSVIAVLVLIYLFIPIAVVATLSFNKPEGKYNTSWNQFSLDAWTNICGVPGVCDSFMISVRIGII